MLPAQADDHNDTYTLYDDLKTLGYVYSVQDVDDGTMCFSVACNSRDLNRIIPKALIRASWFIDRGTPPDSEYGQFATDWKQNSSSFAAKFAYGIDSSRVRLRSRIIPEGSGRASLTIQAQIETAGAGGTWRHASDRDVRNGIRKFAGICILRSIYGDTDAVQIMVTGYVLGGSLLTREEFTRRFPPDP